MRSPALHVVSDDVQLYTNHSSLSPRLINRSDIVCSFTQFYDSSQGWSVSACRRYLCLWLSLLRVPDQPQRAKFVSLQVPRHSPSTVNSRIAPRILDDLVPPSPVEDFSDRIRSPGTFRRRYTAICERFHQIRQAGDLRSCTHRHHQVAASTYRRFSKALPIPGWPIKGGPQTKSKGYEPAVESGTQGSRARGACRSGTGRQEQRYF